MVSTSNAPKERGRKGTMSTWKRQKNTTSGCWNPLEVECPTKHGKIQQGKSRYEKYGGMIEIEQMQFVCD